MGRKKDESLKAIGRYWTPSLKLEGLSDPCAALPCTESCSLAGGLGRMRESVEREPRVRKSEADGSTFGNFGNVTRKLQKPRTGQ